MAEKSVLLSILTSASTAGEELIELWGKPRDGGRGLGLHHPKERGDSALGRAALRALLFRLTRTDQWDLLVDRRGKPLVHSSGAISSSPAISMGHSRGAVICAVANMEILGVDIERRRSRPYAAIASYAFGAREQGRVAAGGAAAFYRIWTLREAIAKATGDGLSLAADGRDRVHDGPDNGRWHQHLPEFGARAWLLGHWCVEDDLSVALAALPPPDHRPDDWRIEFVDGDALLRSR